MRVLISLAICIGAGAASEASAIALLETPASPNPAGATVTVQGTKPDTAPLTRDEQNAVARGFHLMQNNGQVVTQNGERVFCRKEMPIGSRIATEDHCGTAKQLRDEIDEAATGWLNNNPNYRPRLNNTKPIVKETTGPGSATDESVKATETDPSADARAMLLRGDDHLAHGDREHAISDYTQALAIDAKLANAYINRGVAFLGKSDWDRAIADFTAAIELGPHPETAAYLDRGQALEAKGDRDRALADFDEVIRLEPNSIEALRHRGFLRQAKGDFAGAVADYGQMIALSPEDAVARRGRGYAELSAGQYDAAIADLTEAIALNPKNVLAYRFRSLAYKAKHDARNAASDDQMAQSLRP